MQYYCKQDIKSAVSILEQSMRYACLKYQQDNRNIKGYRYFINYVNVFDKIRYKDIGKLDIFGKKIRIIQNKPPAYG